MDILPSSSYSQVFEKSFDSTAASTTGPTAATARTSILSFRNLSYRVKAKGGNIMLVDDVSLDIRSGELLAIMGPSGAGKSTLLDLLSFRKQPMDGASVYYNGKIIDREDMQELSMFVEQEDALIGVLTVRESVRLSLELHNPNLPKREVNARVQRVLSVMGLLSCADQRIGTPISRGISGGQKRRVTAACAMVTYPKIFFLDEVTSGLDSTTAREVMTAIRNLAIAEGMTVLVTIHQPSYEVLSQFTDVLLLAKGKTCFYGKVTEMEGFFEKWGHPADRFVSPAEHAMNYLNDDFSLSTEGLKTKLTGRDSMREFFLSNNPRQPDPEIFEIAAVQRKKKSFHAPQTLDIALKRTLVLTKRSMINYSRNLLAYGVRAGMYAGMGLMVATIWIRLGLSDSRINDRLSVYFYAIAFLSFMSVAGIPSFLEERAVFYREKNNGMCTTLPFVLSNTIVSLPFLFLCTTLFMVIFYWGVGLHPGAAAFFKFFAFIYMAIIAAESQAVIVASAVPVFVAALAISAFVNGFLMSVGGFLVKARSLPRFWFFSFHYMDYQKYSFELVARSDLAGLTFTCDSIVNDTCACAYPSSTPQDCIVSGTDILNYLEIDTISYAKWSGILISIVVIYRIILYFILRLGSSR